MRLNLTRDPDASESSDPGDGEASLVEALQDSRPKARPDLIPKVCLAVLIVAALPFVFPILSAETLEEFSLSYVDMVNLAVVVAAFGIGAGRLSHHPERRRFVMFLTAAFVLWFTVRLIYVVFPDSIGTFLGDVSGDLLYLFFYLALILAAESKPHLRAGWSKADSAHKIQVRGAAVFLLVMLGYFVLIPSTLNYEVYGTWLPSLYMYLALDLYVAFRFIYIRAACPSPSWRRVYGLLALAAAFWAFTDAIECMSYAGVIEMPAVGWSDLLWFAPYPLLVIVGSMTHRISVLEDGADAEEIVRREVSITRAVAPQVVMAFLFPAIHVGLYGIGLLDDATRQARDILVFVALVAMGSLVVVQQLILEQCNRTLSDDLGRINERLSQAQRMEAVGRLAGGIAHDFNNLLTAILGHSQLLLGRLTANDRSRKDVEKIDKAGRRAANLTKQLLAFSRRQVLQPIVIDLNAVIRDIEDMLDRLIGENIRVVTCLQPGAVAVLADPGQLEQVVMNLVLNARDAMPDGGELTLITEQPPRDASIAPGIGPGDWVVLRVRDTGAGMRDEVRNQAFEPFFTTKEQGKGTGLGLSTVYGIVTQSGGEVAIESNMGEGTTVTIVLPRVTDIPAMVTGELDRTVEIAERGTETVLLVEDEAAVRELARDILEIHGYTVIEASDGRSAIDLYRDHEGDIELLLTDVVMPHVGGLELAQELHRRRPELPVVYMSGYSDEASFRDGALGKGEVFLAKPFTPDALVAKLMEVLRSTRGIPSA